MYSSTDQRATFGKNLVKEWLKAPVTAGDFLKVDVTAFANVISGEAPPKREVLYRQAYRDLLDIINEEYTAAKKRGAEGGYFVSVTGTPGIGKTTMLFVFLLEYLKAGKPVALIRHDRVEGVVRLVFRPNPNADAVRGGHAAADAAEDTVFVEITNATLPEIVTLTDIGNPGTDYDGLTIWAHSPGAQDGSSLAKQFMKAARLKLVMPLWTDEEVATAHARWHVPESVTELGRNQSLWDNVPRQIFKPYSVARQNMEELLKCLRSEPETSIRKYLHVVHSEGGSGNVRDRLMLMKVNTSREYPRRYRESYRDCTPYVWGQLLDMLNQRIDEAQRRLLRLCAAVPETGGMFGNMFEAYAHRMICQSTTEYALVPAVNQIMEKIYKQANTTLEPRQLVLPPVTRIFFDNVDELRERLQIQKQTEDSQRIGLLQEAVYYQPSIRNLAAVDSFILIDRVLYLFQFTVSPTHDVNCRGLNKVLSLIADEQSSAQPLTTVFVFVVPEHVHANFRMGALKGADGDDLKVIQGGARKVLYYKTSLPFYVGDTPAIEMNVIDSKPEALPAPSAKRVDEGDSFH